MVLLYSAQPNAATLSPLEAGEWAVVPSVIDGDTVSLDNGRQVRLVGIQAPKLSLDRPNFIDWPLAKESKQALENLVLNQQVQLFYDQTRTDRHGRILAHLYLKDGSWVQGEMISGGMARGYSFADNRQMARDIQKLEQAARSAKKGIWADPYYAIRNSQEILKEKYRDSFQIVEGAVVDVAEVKRTIYLNFGDNWRTDFTAYIPYTARSLFTKAKIKPKDFQGRKIRVRGWVETKNGPAIELNHPEQLEILD